MHDFILKNCLTKTGKLNNRITDISWWINRNLEQEYEKILDLTSFLPEDSSLTKRCFHVVNEQYEVEKCIHCLKNEKSFINFTEGYSEYCSRKCSTKCKKRSEKIRNTNLERYGVVCSAQFEETKIKIKNTNILKYGVEFYTQSEDVKTKSSITKNIRYNNSKYNNKDKAKETVLKKYGVEYVTQDKDIIERMQLAKLKNYNELLLDKEYLINENKTKSISTIAKELNVTDRTVYLWFYKHTIEWITHIPIDSIAQREIYDYIKSLGISNIIYNDRSKIKPKELDIYLPEFNIAIEHNGAYWHKENRTKHINKLTLCNNNGIKLLQFWDYQWLSQKEICKSIIKTNLGLNSVVYARKCIIKELTSSEYNTFMDENHMQGKVNTAKRYGLVYNNELVSVIGFSKSRYDKNYDWELIRYANKLNINVVGGFSRLLKHFENTNNGSIISYCDLMLFTGDMYKNCGFKFTKNTVPGFSYSNGTIIKSREHFQKHKVQNVLRNYDSNKSIQENLEDNKWFRIWNCGNGVWIKNFVDNNN